jgi:hydrogenase maturation protease
MKTLILGVGNPIITDDGVGIRIARELRKKITDENIDILDASIEGLAVLDVIEGYDKLIIVDSIKTRDGSPGECYKVDWQGLRNGLSPATAHNVNICTAIEMGRRLGQSVPDEIVIYAVEVKDNLTFGENLTEDLERKVPDLVCRIYDDVIGK